MIKKTSNTLSNISKITILFVIVGLSISLYFMLNNTTSTVQAGHTEIKATVKNNKTSNLSPVVKKTATKAPDVKGYIYEHLIPEPVGTEDTYDHFPYMFALAEVIDITHPLYNELYALVIKNGKPNEDGDLILVLKNNTPRLINLTGYLNKNHPDYEEIMAENQRRLYLPTNKSENLDHDFVGNYLGVELVITTHNTLVAYRTSVNTDGPITSESLKKVFDKHISTSKGEVDDYLASNIRPILQQGEFQEGEIYCSNTYCIGHHRDTNTGRKQNKIITNSAEIRLAALKETVNKHCAECYIKETCSTESHYLNTARLSYMTFDELRAHRQKTSLQRCTIEIIKQ
jgi:hypothetical protein